MTAASYLVSDMFYSSIEWLSLECLKAIGFACTTLHDWLKKKLAPLFHPIRSKTKTNVTRSHTFSTCHLHAFTERWVHWIVCAFCDWLE